jgi:hypothetical protein
MQGHFMDIEEIEAHCASHERQLHTIAESLKVQGDMLRSQIEFHAKMARQVLSLSQEIGKLKARSVQRATVSIPKDRPVQ